PPAVKLGLLFGLLQGSLITSYLASTAPSNLIRGAGPKSFSFGFRPDLHAVFAWFAGLVALETGRLDNWNMRRLFLGSALLTYASTLHYVFVSGWMGVVVYLVWAVRANGQRIARQSVLAMIAGGCLLGFPYLLLFVIPNIHDALAFVR